MLAELSALHRAGKLAVFSDLEGLSDPDAFAAWLAPLRRAEWLVDAKPHFGGPEAVPACLGRDTHRVAISSTRLVSADAETVAFRWKDCRIRRGDRVKVMRPTKAEFILRLPGAKPRATTEATDTDPAPPLTLGQPCPDYGGPMRIVETFRRGECPLTRAPPRKAAT